uniref:Uncharacterized protein n=1 Tax=Paramormyrops kingsleyae TaxID=1676925 RepID=A0A3B3SYE4_9TELE|nr:uncharacterized protein C1orf115 homolog [Paramormyrops kingsleyae]
MDTEKVDFNLQDNEGEKRELAAGTGNSEIPINQNARQRTEKVGKKCSKPVHLSFLPEKYEPLIEADEEVERRKEEKKSKRKERNKKYRKNLGKALRFSWKCLVVGLQTLTAGYSTPISAAVNLASGFQGTKSKA